MRESYPVNFELEVSWYEEDPTRFGTDIPSPTIRNVKVNVYVLHKYFNETYDNFQMAGKGQKMYLLRWGKSGTWVEEEKLKDSIFELDEQVDSNVLIPNDYYI